MGQGLDFGMIREELLKTTFPDLFSIARDKDVAIANLMSFGSSGLP
jgi:hypothetical protein